VPYNHPNMPGSPPRIQFVISGPFLVLLFLAAAFFQAGFWLYTHQPPPPKPQTPPYYVNRTLTATRPCFQCVGTDGKLQPSPEWKLGKASEIPAGQQWWFAPVEDPSTPVKIDDIPMLAVHPASNNEAPWEGFDQRKILLVVFQDLDARFAIEHPAPPVPPPSPTPAAPAEPPPAPKASPPDNSPPPTVPGQQP
jgi:hypothetical protein